MDKRDDDSLAAGSRSLPRERPNVDPHDVVRAFAAFDGHRVIGRSTAFRAASLGTLFGDVTLDLSEAQLAPEGAVVDAMSAFGEIEVLVPAGWRVSVAGNRVFGGFHDETGGGSVEMAVGPEMQVRGTAVFGGVTVKHPS